VFISVSLLCWFQQGNGSLFSAHRAFVMESALSVTVHILEKSKENSKIICKSVVKFLHFAQT
jgi:hypothetical protein